MVKRFETVCQVGSMLCCCVRLTRNECTPVYTGDPDSRTDMLIVSATGKRLQIPGIYIVFRVGLAEVLGLCKNSLVW